MFSRGYFVGLSLFIVSMLVGPKFILMDISRVQIFFLVDILWITREYISMEQEEINDTLLPQLIWNKLHLRIE